MYTLHQNNCMTHSEEEYLKFKHKNICKISTILNLPVYYLDVSYRLTDIITTLSEEFYTVSSLVYRLLLGSCHDLAISLCQSVYLIVYLVVLPSLAVIACNI